MTPALARLAAELAGRPIGRVAFYDDFPYVTPAAEEQQ